MTHLKVKATYFQIKLKKIFFFFASIIYKTQYKK